MTVSSLTERAVVAVPALPLALKLIKQADIICYPMGSFWTSVAANLLPRGVGSAIVQSTAHKVFIPSTGRDPEQLGMSLSSAIEALVSLGRRDAGEDEPLTAFVNTVILDRDHERYSLRLDVPAVKRSGISVMERSLAGQLGCHSPALLAKWLVQMVS